MERFNLKKLHDVEIKEEYQVKISNRSVLWKMNDNGTSKGSGGGGQREYQKEKIKEFEINKLYNLYSSPSIIQVIK
jgi:hypothetical protein